MTNVEIDFVQKDCLNALTLYEAIFDITRVEVTSFPPGQNEAVFTICGARFHMLDANPDYGLNAPDPEHPNTIWFNITVPDIALVHERALKSGCQEIQPVTEIPSHGVSNSMFADPFGYIWMLHQVHREVSFEERVLSYT